MKDQIVKGPDGKRWRYGHIYQLTCKGGHQVKVPLSVLDKFDTIATSFQGRLAQFKELFPRLQVIDWDMVDIKEEVHGENVTRQDH